MGIIGAVMAVVSAQEGPDSIYAISITGLDKFGRLDFLRLPEAV